MQVLAETRDDEERVVDADTEADHRHEQRRDRVDVGQAGEDEEQQERRHERDDRERERDRRRHERAEHDQQHDERGKQAEELLRSLLDRRELGVAVELDGHAGRRDRRADGILHGDDLLTVLLVDDAVELRFRVGDPSVVGEGVLAEGVSDALQAGALVRSDRLELRRLQLGYRRFDRRLALRRIEPLAFRCREHEVQDTALLGCELGLDEVRRSLRVRARDLELVLQAASHRRDEKDEPGDDPDPGDHHAPRMAGARPHPARERPGRESFVCGEPIEARVGPSRVVRHVLPPLLRCSYDG